MVSRDIPLCVGDVWQVLPSERVVVVITDDDYNSFSYTELAYDSSVDSDMLSLHAGCRVALYGDFRLLLSGFSSGLSAVVTKVVVLRDALAYGSAHRPFKDSVWV